MPAVPASNPKIVQLVRVGHSDILALTESGEMYYREKDSKDMRPNPRYLWKRVPGPFEEPPPRE